ncbi:MAG: N-acetyltransferase, partial [Thauera sp.]|nr:N-acetyltransferase [Thauera sp.]
MTSPDEFRLLGSIADIAPQDWDALLPPAPTPCLHHAYLHALEASGCVGEASGWTPRHATLWTDGRLAAAMPLYLKTHSWGEYVFDWAWAEAYQRHGLDYYPKWLCAIPFTPVPGPRVLGQDPRARERLMAGVSRLAESSALSSLHVLFPGERELASLQQNGLSLREGVQFRWSNTGTDGSPYADFDAFLGSLN